MTYFANDVSRIICFIHTPTQIQTHTHTNTFTHKVNRSFDSESTEMICADSEWLLNTFDKTY